MSKRQFRKRKSSGLSNDQRTIVAECRSVYGPMQSKYTGEYYRVDWRIKSHDGHEMLGHTDVANNMDNFQQWQPFIDGAQRGSCWVVVVHDDLGRSTPEDVLIDADHAPVDAAYL